MPPTNPETVDCIRQYLNTELPFIHPGAKGKRRTELEWRTFRDKALTKAASREQSPTVKAIIAGQANKRLSPAVGRAKSKR